MIRIGYDNGLVESTTLSINQRWSGIKFTHPKRGKAYGNSYGTLPHHKSAAGEGQDERFDWMGNMRPMVADCGYTIGQTTRSTNMTTKPTIARIWRGRTRRDVADTYEPYIRAEGIPLLQKVALGVQLFREDREDETWFTAISYWSDIESMTAFTRGEPTKVHHLDRDDEFLIELPTRIELHRILVDDRNLQ